MHRSTRFLAVIVCVLAAFPLVAPVIHAQQSQDPWAPLQFLVGSWSGTGSGKPGEAVAGSTTFSFDLDKNILVRTSKAEYAPKPGSTKPTVHEDLMIIYPSQGGQAFRAMYFDNEGHIIPYVVSFPEGRTSAVFETEAAEKAPRFKLVYELGSDGALSTEFFVAPPGGEFRSYVKGTVKKTAQ